MYATDHLIDYMIVEGGLYPALYVRGQSNKSVGYKSTSRVRLREDYCRLQGMILYSSTDLVFSCRCGLELWFTCRSSLDI
jgi:hypothetical protein